MLCFLAWRGGCVKLHLELCASSYDANKFSGKGLILYLSASVVYNQSGLYIFLSSLGSSSDTCLQQVAFSRLFFGSVLKFTDNATWFRPRLCCV